MENTFVKFYYGSNAQKYIDNWKNDYEGGIFFDTQNKQIYYNGDSYGKTTTTVDLTDINTALGELESAFVSVDTRDNTNEDGSLISLVIEFTNKGGDIAENVAIPIMNTTTSKDEDITSGLISKDDWTKLDNLYTSFQQGDIVNKINNITIDGASSTLNEKTKTLNIDLTSAIQSAVNGIVSSVYSYQGSVDSLDSLNAITNPVTGHVYNLLFPSDEYGPIGVNVAWDGVQWDSLGGILNTTDVSGDIQDLAKIVELMNSDASTDLDEDENLDNERKYSISYKINTEIQNMLKWTELN